MRIDSSAVGMNSARSYRETNVSIRRFFVTQHTDSEAKELQTAADGKGEKPGTENGERDKTGENKAGARSASLTEWQGRMQYTAGAVTVRSSESQTLTNIRQMTIRYIFDLLFSHRRNRLEGWNKGNAYNQPSNGGNKENPALKQGSGGNKENLVIPQGISGGVRVLHYSQETFHVESETTAFSTTGTVKTADGREINFNVNVGMSREFESYFASDLQMATFKLCDPLVINLDSDVADVEDQTFYFDLDADGEIDEISQLGKGSGFLALDKNGDGVINDGSELFGTQSGNGFADLAKYDEDGNGWIDENDAVWDKLKIWCKDENGKDVLYRLADKGVGAICLQNVSTDFTIQGQGGKTQGVVRNTGVFLYENGLAGTIQHVDMAKYDVGA